MPTPPAISTLRAQIVGPPGVVRQAPPRSQLAALLQSIAPAGLGGADIWLLGSAQEPPASSAQSALSTRPFTGRFSEDATTIRYAADVALFGPGASDQLAQQWQQWINSTWNENRNTGGNKKNFRVDGKRVVFDIRVTATSATETASVPSGDVKVRVVKSPRGAIEGVPQTWRPGEARPPGEPDGTWIASGEYNSRRHVAHEFGHCLGLPDDYRLHRKAGKNGKPDEWTVDRRSTKGHDGHLMSSPRYYPGPKLAQHEVADAVRYLRAASSAGFWPRP